MTGPRVFALPPGADFAADFARGYHRRFGDLPLADRARATVLVNTTRAASEIAIALADHAPAPGLLPTIRLIPDLGDDPLLGSGLPPAVPPLRRHLRLTHLVEQFLASRQAAGETHAPTGAAADLAESLAFLIDQFHDHGVPPARLIGAADGLGLATDAAEHWQQTLAFFEIVLKAWPAIRDGEEAGGLDPRDRQAHLIDALVERWRHDPPAHPVIAAASTGSVGTTARLMAAVANLPRGAVVLPGLDPETDPGIWASSTADHPLGPFHGFFAELGIAPADVGVWQPAPHSPRRALLTQAMRPAPVTDHWHRAAGEVRKDAPAALEGLSLLEAEGTRQEAAAIAVAIREVLEDPEARVALITADAELARRVTAMLDRFGIVPDDTMGEPLAQSVPGTLLRLVLDAARPGASALETAALLQHPLVRPGVRRSEHLLRARAYEGAVLRRAEAGHGPGILPEWAGADDEAGAWHAAITGALEPVAAALRVHAALGPSVEAVIAALEALTDDGTGADPAVWTGDGGADLHGFLADLARNADALGGIPVTDLAALLSGLLRGQTLRPKPREHHPRVRICGTREARIEGAGYVILAGLNDGVWPAVPDPGPWLSRPMHEVLGLPMPERAVGLSAHDFLQAACRPRVLLTRALRAEGAPTVASRWLVRLETLLMGVGATETWDEVRERGARYHRIAAAMDRPVATVPRAERPRPVPPPEAVPRKLPVTQVELLVRDAYAVYARYVLGLRPLEPLGRRPDARERGEVLHKVLEAFLKATPDWPGPEEALARLNSGADALLAAYPVPPDLRRAWRGRIGRFAEWFIREEEHRRAAGRPLKPEREGSIDLPVGAEIFTLTARTDRIDALSDGRGGVIYDYKSGNPPSEKQIRQRFNQQLHLAAAILEAGGFEGIPAMKPCLGAYIGLTGGREGGKELVYEGLAGDLPAYRAELVELLAAYLDGTPWISRGRPQLISYDSDYDHLARTAEWSGEDAP